MTSVAESFVGDWNFPTQIRFGPGRVDELPEACGELGISAPLLVTDPVLAALPFVERTRSLCSEAGLRCGLFCEVRGNPVGDNVSAGVEAFRSGGHDGVIALGGGSSLDVGKAVGLMVGQDLPIWEFEDIGNNFLKVDERGMVPVVAVPTTSGTGSEVGRCSVLLHEDEGRKVIIFHPKMMPGRVLADPELTLDLPAHITAAVGMDAFSHNLEAFCAPGFHPMADGIALEGIRLVHIALLRAFRNGHDLGARSQMMAASTLGATSFQKGLGAMHALSHPVSSVYNSHHGLTNAVVMPYVLAFNRPRIEGRIVQLSRLLDLAKPSFDGFLEWVLELRAELQIPHTLSSLGVVQEDCSDLAEAAAKDPTATQNPVPVHPKNLAELYAAAIDGDLARASAAFAPPI